MSFYPYLLLALSSLGMASNVASLFIFAKQKFRKNFHRLLVILAVYDFMVVVLCAMLWSLPQIWPEYEAYVYPYWASFLLPMVQIALMSSVYCTVVMSWERYVRICLVSRLDCNYFSDGKFRMYLFLIIVFPIIFYIPKFFELEPVVTYSTEQLPVSCEPKKLDFSSVTINGTIYHLTEPEEVELDLKILQTIVCSREARNESLLFDFEEKDGGNNSVAYLAVNLTKVVIGHTDLMKNDIYYNTYCIAINTIFASVFPFISLMFFNISIALKLHKKKPNFLITYLRHGRKSSSRESVQEAREMEVMRNGRSKVYGPAEEGHRLCIRFSKAENPSSSVNSKANSLELARDENAIEVVSVKEEIVVNANGTDESPERTGSDRGRRVSLGNVRLRRSNSPVCRRRESRLTRISLAIVWLFLFCHIWKLIPTAYEVFYGGDKYPLCMYFIKHLSHALIVLNSSVNFLIYVVL